MKLEFYSYKLLKQTLLGVILLFITSCIFFHGKIAKPIDSFQIVFGSSGGFTNSNPVFIVKSTGELLKQKNAASTPIAMGIIDKNYIDSIIILISDSSFVHLKINQISNITNYIEIKSDKYHNKLQWYNDTQIPENVKKLHKILITTVKK